MSKKSKIDDIVKLSKEHNTEHINKIVIPKSLSDNYQPKTVITKIRIPKNENNIKNDIFKITNEEFDKIIQNITNPHFITFCNMLYKGVENDLRSFEEKKEDPFVIFLFNEIEKTKNEDLYFLDNEVVIENVLLIKMPKEELKNKINNIKVAMFRIFLQRIKNDILGFDSSANKKNIGNINKITI